MRAIMTLLDEEVGRPLLDDEEHHAAAAASPGERGEKEDGLLAMDWLGRPAGSDLGGWKCSVCILGSFGLSYAAYFGVVANLVVYLVQIWGENNAVAANTVTNLLGTTFVCSFIGAFASDAYLGRLWGAVSFAFLSFLSFVLSSLGIFLISRDVPARTFFLVSLYIMVIATGSTFPNLTSLGADQLCSSDAKGKYFTWVAMTISISQLFATTLVTYMDNSGMWVWGFWLCCVAAGLAVVLTASVAWACRQYRAAGNPMLRIIQVLVVACRNHARIPPKDSSLLHETRGELSAIPGCRKLHHTDSLSFLDKAAALAEYENDISPWQVCTVTQVEEVKCLLQVIPVGIASTCIAAAAAQINTTFEEQAIEMNTQVLTWLAIPPASLHVFSIGGSILTGIAMNVGGARIFGRFLGWVRRQRHAPRASSLQVQGLAILVGIIAMIVAALVEAHRLSAAHKDVHLSVMWLVPQTFLLGASTNLMYTGSMDFFYSEVSDGMRTVSSAISLLCLGAGNYLSSIFVVLVTYFSSQGGQSGWISSNLNDGHVDYFYWFLAAFLTFTLALYLVYTHLYTYRKAS